MVSSNPALQKCTPNSIALAAYEAATLGLPVNKLQLAYLVPYGNEAKLLISYRGYIQLALDTGFVFDISAEIAYANDHFKQVLGSNPRIDHEPADGERGEAIAVYAIARLANGIKKQVVMTKAQVEKIRNACSKSANGTTWTQHWEEMAKKTAIKRLCKTLPSQGRFEAIGRAVEIDSEAQEKLQAQTQAQPLFAPNNLRNQLLDSDNDESERRNLIATICDLHATLMDAKVTDEPLPNCDQLDILALRALEKNKLAQYMKLQN